MALVDKVVCSLSFNVDEFIENEWYAVRYSGEIPEIAYHSALYFLSASAEGPGLTLSKRQLLWLQDAAAARYEDIILRDLEPANIAKTIYRGVARAICNYERYHQFCWRQGRPAGRAKKLIASSFKAFLDYHLAHPAENRGKSLNCSFADLQNYGKRLGVPLTGPYLLLEALCEDANP